MKNLSIFKKIIIVFISVGLTAIIAESLIADYIFRKTIIENTNKHFEIDLQKKKHQIEKYFDQTKQKIETMSRFFAVKNLFEILENYSEYFYQIKKVEDLKKTQNSEKVGAIFHFEGAGGIDSEFNNLKNFYRLGLRSMGITWSNSNRFGTGVGKNKERGLTAEGKELVQEMNRLGIIVDVSHLNEKSFWDVIEVSNKPVIASHSNAWEICHHDRNLKDDQIEAIKESGGTIGLNLCISFLKEGAEKPEKVGFKQIIQHINYIVEKAGIDHLTLGSDFDGARVPEVIKDVSYYPNLLRILEEEGFSSEDIEKITHKNIERVIKKVWK